jgi:TP901 family phage tail tape measure protein
MQDDSFVRIISKLGVDYSQAILSTRQLAMETERLNNILAQTRITAATIATASGQTVAQQLLGSKVIYDQYGGVLSVVADRTQKVADKTRKVKDAVTYVDDYIRPHIKTVKDLSDQYNVLGSQFERRASWFLAGSLFFGSIGAMQQAVTTIAEVEMGMTQIARITEDATFNFTEMRDELLKMGQEYGMTWDKVQDISLRWAQAGYNVKDTLELTRASLLALNTAELNAQYATQGLIAIMAQWGLTADQLLPTIDKINKVADDFAVTSQDLVDGLNRSSGAARVLGLNLNQTIAILTVMREATGRTGKEVGNALNSILSFMQRDIALQAFAREGIAVWADESRTQFRNVIDIFDEVAARWQNMSDATREMFVQAADQAGLYSEEMAELAGIQKEFNDLQQRDISQAMAGIYRRNYLLALLQNWVKIDKVLISMEDSLGYSMKENERTMQTLQKQYESLKAAAQELAVAIGDTGLLNSLKEVVGGVKDVINWFNELDPVAQRLIITFVEVTAALKILQAVFRMAGAGGAASLLSGWAVSATTAAASTRVLTSAVTGLGAVLMNVGRGIVGFLGGPLGLALTVATTGLLYFTSQSRESAASLEQNAQSAGKLANDLQELLDRYTELANNTNRTKAEQDEFKTVTDQLLKLLPQAITGFDDMGNAITNVGTATEATKQKIGELKEEYASFVRAQATVGQAALPGLKEQLQQQHKQFEDLAEMTRLGASFARGELLDMPMGIWEQAKTFIASDVEILKMAEKKLNDLRTSISDTRKEIAQYEAAIKAAEALASGKTETGPSTTPKRTPSPGYVGPPPSDRKGINALKEDISEAKLAMDAYNDALQLTDTMLQGIAAREQILDLAIKNQKIPTLDQARAKYTLLNEAMSLNKIKQQQLHEAAEEARRQLAPLKDQLAAVTRQHESGALSTEKFNAAVSALRPTINALKKDIAQYGNQWWEAEAAIESAKDAQADMVRTYIKAAREIERDNAMAVLERSQKQSLRNLEDLRDTELESLKAAKDAYREASDARIKAIQDEIDALELENKLLDEQNNLLERQKMVDEARTKVANIETDRRIRRINPLTGEWEWVADEVALREARQELEKAEKDLEKTQRDIRTAARRRELEDRLEHEREIQQQQLKSYDDQINKQQKYWDKRIQNFRDAQDKEKDVQQRHWEKILSAEQINMNAMNDILTLGLDGALAKWRNYYDQMRMLQQQGQVQTYQYGGGSISVSSGFATTTPSQSGLDNARIGSDGLTDYTRAVRDALIRSGAQPLSSYDRGGPILRDQLAMLHKNEYVLNAETVKALGGITGVERLVARLKMPDFDGIFGLGSGRAGYPAAGTVYNNTTSSTDRRVQILGNIYLPQVRDLSGFIRNLEQYAMMN